MDICVGMLRDICYHAIKALHFMRAKVRVRPMWSIKALYWTWVTDYGRVRVRVRVSIILDVGDRLCIGIILGQMYY